MESYKLDHAHKRTRSLRMRVHIERSFAETYSELSPTSKMELFVKIVNAL